MNQKKYFISFGDSRLSAATTRIRKQAEDMCFFDEVHVLNENDLESGFHEQWKHIMKLGSRGYGYWCWKPYIILRLLEQMQKNDILLYCDVGCHLNPKGLPRLYDYIAELNSAPIGVKAFYTFSPHIDVTEKRWTKGDIFDYFNCRNNIDVTDTLQIATTQIFIRKDDTTMQYVREWNNLWYENFALIDDSPSQSPNFPGFIENRHDQSVFSILYKLKGCTPLPSGETDVADYSNMDAYPIWDKRDRKPKEKSIFPKIKRYLKSRKVVFKIRLAKIKNYFNSKKIN